MTRRSMILERMKAKIGLMTERNMRRRRMRRSMRRSMRRILKRFRNVSSAERMGIISKNARNL